MASEKWAKSPPSKGPGATRFKTGNSGRPAGARNKRTLWLEEIDESDLRAVRDAVVEKAREGEMVAGRILFDRVWPVPKARKVAIDIPATTGPEGISAAMAAVTREMAAGNIDPQEAQLIAAVLE